MTTAAEVKKLMRPLLERYPDLAFAQRYLIVKPMRHVMSAVLLDRKLDPDGIAPRWFVNNFFGLGQRIHIGWSEFINHPQTVHWLRTQPDVQSILVQEVERLGLPRMREINDLHAFMACVSQHRFRHHLFDDPRNLIVMLVALGKLDEARTLARTQLAQRSVAEPHLDDEDREHLARAKQLGRLLETDDREAMAKLLHAWEAETVRANRLERLWEPSPFPLEELI